MVSCALPVLLWLAFCKVAKCSVIAGAGQNWDSWDLTNQTNELATDPKTLEPETDPITNVLPPPMLPPPMTFETYPGHDAQRLYLAIPVDSNYARQGKFTSGLAALFGLGGGSGAGLGGLGALGLGALTPPLNDLLALGNLPAIPDANDLDRLHLVRATNAPTSPAGILAASEVNTCPMVCTVNGVNNPLDQMALACSDRCKRLIEATTEALGVCLQSCAKPTREACVGTCSRLNQPGQTRCGAACGLLCPASVTPAPFLIDPTCCVSPPLVCGPKGSWSTQLGNCQERCANLFSTNADNLIGCQRACANFPAESCRVDCDNRFPNNQDDANNGNCAAACASLCNLGTDAISFQTGISRPSLRHFCPASKVPVCQLSVGSTAIGLTRVAQQRNCLASCTTAAFSTIVNRNFCIQACALEPQGNCDTACQAINAPSTDRELCDAACNSLCPV